MEFPLILQSSSDLNLSLALPSTQETSHENVGFSPSNFHTGSTSVHAANMHNEILSSMNVLTPYENLVMARRPDKTAGRKKFNETRHSIYKGVRQSCGKWVCELRQRDHKKLRISLWTFTCPDMEARAYVVAALALRAESAALNFPHEASALPRIASTCLLKTYSVLLRSLFLRLKLEHRVWRRR